MNLEVLTRKRHVPQVGDVFVLRPKGLEFLYGRVLDTNANPLGVGDAILIYIYNVSCSNKMPVPVLSTDRLLVPPLMTNRQPWSKGYFEHVEHRTLLPSERFPRHSFRDTRGRLFDEFGCQLVEPIGPVGQWGLHSYGTIDDDISSALGIPLAAD